MQIKVKRVIEKEEKGGTEDWRNKKINKKKTLEKNKTTRHYLEAILGDAASRKQNANKSLCFPASSEVTSPRVSAI